MKFVHVMLPLVCSAPILLGCSAPAVAPATATAQLNVRPLLRVRDAAGSARDFYQLGRYYQGQNRFAQAVDAYRKALDYHKGDIAVRNALATTYSAQGKLDEAIAEFEAILKIKPELAYLHNNLGYAYYLQGNFGEAIAAFETAMALEPRNPRVYNNLGLAYRKIGDSEKSRLAFARASELKGSSAVTGAATAVPVPTVAAATGNIASTTPSIALKNSAPDIDLPPLSASVSLKGGSNAAALPTTEPTLIFAEPYSLAHRTPEASTPNTTPSMKSALAAKTIIASVTIAPPDASSAAVDRKTFRLEITNGNGINGLARKVGEMLTRYGLTASHLTNLKPYRQPTSFIQYRSGFYDEALRLSQTLSQRPALISNDRLRRSTDVQLVLGKDVANPMALFDTGSDPAKFAQKKTVELDEAS